jgi:4-aminobutyrate aminotransferase-like enzyme
LPWETSIDVDPPATEATKLDSYSQNTRPLYPLLRSGKGIRVVDADGREYLDCASQTLNVNLGQCHDEVIAAVRAQLDELTYASSRSSTEVAAELHEKLIEITPDGLTKLNMTSVIGSAANECALKSARKRSGRQVVVSREGSHLGQTTEAMRVSGKHWDREYLGERNARFLPAPYCHRCPVGQRPETCGAECLDGLDEIVREDGDDVAAVIVEPIMVDAGVLAPPAKYHRRLRQRCDEAGIALIFDEIQTGFGWLGSMFAMDLYDVVPDLVSMGKGLGAGFPLAATAFTPEYDVLDYGEHEMTAGAHVLSCAASLAMIAHLEAPGRLEDVARRGRLARGLFEAVRERWPAIGDVRGHGLLLGLELEGPDGEPEPALAQRTLLALRDRGVAMRLAGVGSRSNVLQFKPPVIITDDELEEVADKLDESLAEATR